MTKPRLPPARDRKLRIGHSALGSGNQIGPAASVTLGEAEANADEVGEVKPVPLRLPTCRLAWRRRTPIGQIEALDPTNQLGLDGFGGWRSRQLVAVRGPAQYEPSIGELERHVGATGRAEPSRQIPDKCQTVRATFDLRRAGGTGDPRWGYRNPAKQRAQNASSAVSPMRRVWAPHIVRPARTP